MRVVLDTNVVVSGTFWTGTSFKILNLVDQNRITLIVSRPILEEYDEIINSEEILEKTTIYQHARIQALLKILSKAIVVEPQESITIVKDDPDDNKFIEAALAGDAQYLITQDKKHLLSIKQFRAIEIVSPEEFMRIIS